MRQRTLSADAAYHKVRRWFHVLLTIVRCDIRSFTTYLLVAINSNRHKHVLLNKNSSVRGFIYNLNLTCNSIHIRLLLSSVSAQPSTIQ